MRSLFWKADARHVAKMAGLMAGSVAHSFDAHLFSVSSSLLCDVVSSRLNLDEDAID